MNKFEKTLEEIKKEYQVRMLTTTYAQIETDILFDAYNYIFIGVLFEDDKIYLTDCAEYTQTCQWEDEDVPEVEKICQKHNLTFKNFHIECFYRSNEDIKNYMECLLELRDKYSDL